MSPPSPLLARLRYLSTLDAPAIEAGDGRLSHAALQALASGVARRLRGSRASLEGERVGILAQPGGRWVAAFFGVILAGGVAVPLSPLHPDAELRYFAQDAAISAVLFDEEQAPRRGLFGVDVIDVGSVVPGPFEAAAASDEDGALILYTSGTTGKPKGAVLTHGNLATQAALLREAWGIEPRDRLLHTLPLHHMHGVAISLLATLLAGASAEMLPRFEARRVWAGMARCTVFMAVPTMYHRLFEVFDQGSEEERAAWSEAARGLRLATSGSAALPVGLAGRWRAVAGSIPLERFGMTEIGVGLSNPLHGERRAGSVGRPLPTVDLRIVDERGEPVVRGEPGEIVVRGPSVFARYFGREEATRGAFRGGWFLTGDTAVEDGDGYVRILGRSSVDILKSGGYKLSALEIEEVLREHPAVGEVAVVGVADEAWGERVVAAVVVRGGLTRQVTADEVRAFCRERMAPYKVPREIVFLGELPRNAVGKVIKPELARRLGSGS